MKKNILMILIITVFCGFANLILAYDYTSEKIFSHSFSDKILDVALSKDGQSLLIAEKDEEVTLYKCIDGGEYREVWCRQFDNDSVGIDISDDGSMFIVARNDEYVSVFKYIDGRYKETWVHQFSDDPEFASMSGDGMTIVIGEKDEEFTVYKSDNGEDYETVFDKYYDYSIMECEINYDGSCIIYGEESGGYSVASRTFRVLTNSDDIYKVIYKSDRFIADLGHVAVAVSGSEWGFYLYGFSSGGDTVVPNAENSTEGVRYFGNGGTEKIKHEYFDTQAKDGGYGSMIIKDGIAFHTRHVDSSSYKLYAEELGGDYSVFELFDNGVLTDIAQIAYNANYIYYTDHNGKDIKLYKLFFKK